ncbi:MAG TPA: tetratricopeptide repeat protein, partial [Gemmataceae bacterium]|nr:tetratricopeptide repeat protein [Gemmataceae bacterium]
MSAASGIGARLAAAAALVLLLAAGAAAVWWWGLGRRDGSDPPPQPADRHRPDDPRVTYAGPYRNVRPGVKTVGDAACAECHDDKAATYRQHPMGRSVVSLREAAGRLPYDAAHHNPFEAFDARFFVERDGDRVLHHRAVYDPSGRAIYDQVLEADYAVGSGTRGYSYLCARDGYYMQTPISWFAQKQRWDLSPGFHGPFLAGRQVLGGCLYCHVNHTDPVEGTLNYYPGERFDGRPIGCERCHGPGELHAEARRRKDPVGDFDDTIVNPGRLSGVLRDAVCEQCHLEGEGRVVRRGRNPNDYRPGLPLSSVLAVFVHEGAADRAVNHVEQMHASGCYKGGRGEDRMGCVSCHDPHRRVGPEERVAYYRRACLACHGGHGCSVPEVERRRTSAADSCIDCHMPRYAASDIPHTASTDHSVPRRPRKAPTPGEPAGGGVVLEPFHPGGAEDREMMTRDLGLALARLADDGKESAPRVATRAMPLLESAVANDPEDWRAWEAKGRLMAALGWSAEALAAFRTVAAGAPRREMALSGGATVAQELGQRDLALEFWKRAAEVNPWTSQYRKGVATVLAEQHAWDELGPACREWLRLDPASVEARMLSVTALLRTGHTDEARKEFDDVRALRPPDL